MLRTTTLTAALLSLFACGRAPEAPTGADSALPRPTDPRGEDDDEERRRERDLWIDEIHRTGPDDERRAPRATRLRRSSSASWFARSI
ncbi:MAG: hypothetical protein AAFZ87_19140, partial [Planctomycetota bacterium]